MDGYPEERRLEPPTAVAVASVPQRRISWGAVLAGTVVAVVTFITLALLGMAVGMATYDPATQGDTARGLATGGMIWWLISAIIALFLGGWAAGRLATVGRRLDAVLHGVATWGATTLVVMLLLATAVGTVIGGALNVVSMNGQTPITGVAGNMERMMGYDSYHHGAMMHSGMMRSDMDKQAQETAGESAEDNVSGTTPNNSGTTGGTTNYDHTQSTTGTNYPTTTVAHTPDNMTPTEAVHAQRAAHAAAAAAGWSVLMLVLGVGSAAAGGGLAVPRTLDRVVTREEKRVIANT